MTIAQFRVADGSGAHPVAPPPHDLDAEGAVLSAIMLDADAVGRVRGTGLRAGHFYSDANRRIYSTALEIAGRGEPIDVVTVTSALNAADRLRQVGGSPYIVQLADATPAVAHVEAHARRVIETSARRELRAIGQKLMLEVGGDTDVTALAAEMARAVEQAVSGTSRGLVRLGVSDMFSPLPPVPWLVQSLDLCPGAPALVAGYGFSGKTAAMQAMAVEIAAGLPVWGTFSARQGRVLHLDYEQGRRLTAERYQRLAAAHMLDPDELGDRLEVAPLPRLYLDDPGAEEALARECEGVALLIVDSLRAACPTIEENSSEVRRVLDALGRVSEKTGTTCVVIHHARKPSQDKSGGARMAIRGSGAIFDACSSVLVLEGQKGKPVRVAHEKARTSGVTAADLEIVISDVDIDGNPRGGLQVLAQSASSVAGVVDTVGPLVQPVLDFVNTHPGCSVRRLREECRAGGRAALVDVAVERLLEDGAIEDRGSRTKRAFYAVEEPSE